MQTAQQICYQQNLVLLFLLEHNTTNTMQTQLFSNEQHAFEQNSNTNFLNLQNSLYITEIDYTLLTAKQIDPKFGLMQIQIPRKKIVQCDQCHSEMQVEEGTVIYDKKWFHDSCWQSITRGATIGQ